MKKIQCTGFTLIELIIASSIALFMLAQVLFIGNRINRESSKRYERASHSISINNALSVMQDEIRNSISILSVSDGKRLVLDHGTYILAFELTSGKIKRIKDASAQYLTDDEQAVSMTFAYPDSSLVSVNVKSVCGQTFTAEAFCRNG